MFFFFMVIVWPSCKSAYFCIIPNVNCYLWTPFFNARTLRRNWEGFPVDCMFLSCHIHVIQSYRVWTHSETRMWHYKNIQSNAPYRQLQHSSIIWPVWLNGWVFVYKLIGCGFKSSCSHFQLISPQPILPLVLNSKHSWKRAPTLC